VKVRNRCCRLAFIALLGASAPSAQELVQQPAAIEEQTRKNVGAPCLEPPPLVSWKDYQGPFQKVVGMFARTLERKAVHTHYKPGTLLCSLEPKDKFILFIHDSFDPLSFLTAGFNAGLDQARNKDPTFGQGSEGYGKRFGTDFASQTSQRFFTDFAYPTIFSEDPRYYRLAHGSGEKRLLHAVGHTFLAHRDNGQHMFNFSEWMGTTTAVVLSNAYHPGNERGFAPAARQVGYAVITDMGFDVLREFWPEIARKLRMPFRDRREPGTEAQPRPPSK
jgi:hypothetical protein